MIQYTLWSRADFKNVIRREVMDTNTRWFSDAELNLYLDNWLQEFQQEFEFVWAVSTVAVGTVTSTQTTTVGTNTYFAPPRLVISTATFTPAMLRNEAVYYNGFRLSGRFLQDLEVGDPVWRGDLGNGTAYPSDSNPSVYDTPRVAVMYPDSQNILIWPTPPPANTIPFGSGTNSNVFVFEYPALLTFASDQSRSGLPVWTQYAARPYVCAKLFQRPGPLNDVRKAARYWAQYQRAKLRVRRMWDNFLPERFRRLQPGQHYEWEILTPPPAWNCGTNTAQGIDLAFGQFLLPSDAGATVTLPTFAPVHSAQIYLNGQLLAGDGIDYTRTGLQVTFTFTPDPLDILLLVVT